MSDTHDRIDAIVRHYAACGETHPITAETTLDADLCLDSLDRIEMGQALEEEFSISIPDDELDAPEMGTFGGLCDYIDKRLVPA